MTRKQRLTIRKYTPRVARLAVFGLLLACLIAGWELSKDRIAKYEAYRCAVYGYEADCKTPLPIERRLK